MKKLFVCFILLIVSQLLSRESTVYIIPFCENDVTTQRSIKPPLKEALVKLGYTVKNTLNLKGLNNVAYIICFGAKDRKFLSSLKEHPREKCIQVICEPPSVYPIGYTGELSDIFSKSFTWNDELADGSYYIKFFSPYFGFYRNIHPLGFTSKKFCTMITGNKKSRHPNELYSERRKVIEFFEAKKTGEFDFYGRNWLQENYLSYKGVTENKIETLSQYKFCICYENVKEIKGYVSEKIFDCFVAGCVPIYWGASNITDYIPNECFIDRRNFSNNEELHSFLQAITEKEYLTYLDSIQRFLTSSQSAVFSSVYFTHIILSNLIPTYNPTLVFDEKQLRLLEKAIMHRRN